MAIQIGIVLLVLVLALLAFIAMRPSGFHLERSAQVNAPADVVHAIINDLRQWEKWSPYDKRDPAMKKTFEGPSAGPGAKYAWSGNNQVGEGRMTILESKPGALVKMKLEFIRPFTGTNEVNFILVPTGNGTRVTWAMDGKYHFMAKAMCLVMDMDKMVGKDFEQGLANLDTVAQGGKVVSTATC